MVQATVVVIAVFVVAVNVLVDLTVRQCSTRASACRARPRPGPVARAWEGRAVGPAGHRRGAGGGGVRAGTRCSRRGSAPATPAKGDIAARLKPPGFRTPAGDRPAGRDLLSRILFGTRLSPSPAWATVAITIALWHVVREWSLATTAGWWTGWWAAWSTSRWRFRSCCDGGRHRRRRWARAVNVVRRARAVGLGDLLPPRSARARHVPEGAGVRAGGARDGRGDARIIGRHVLPERRTRAAGHLELPGGGRWSSPSRR